MTVTRSFTCSKCSRTLPLTEKDILMTMLLQRQVCKQCADRISKDAGNFLHSIKGKLANHQFVVRK